MEDSTRVNRLSLSDSDPEESRPQKDADSDADEGRDQDAEPGLESLDTVSGLSSCSSPLPLEPFQPRYSVRLQPKGTSKDGDVTMYSLRSLVRPLCSQSVSVSQSAATSRLSTTLLRPSGNPLD